MNKDQQALFEEQVKRTVERCKPRTPKPRQFVPDPKINYCLPLYRDELRAMPNHLARSALFSPIARNNRKTLVNSRLDTPEGVDIFFSGEQLSMSDADVFMQLIKHANQIPLGTDVIINRRDFLKDLGRTDGGASYEWLNKAIFRLSFATLHIVTKKYNVYLSLIGRSYEDKETGKIAVAIPAESVVLFSDNEYGLVSWEARKALNKNAALGKWLQSFIASHRPGEQKFLIENIKKWSGHTGRLDKFKIALMDALLDLERLGVINAPEFYDERSKVKWERYF